MSSLKINLRPSGERSRLSHTISRIRCLNAFVSESEDREVVAGEITSAEAASSRVVQTFSVKIWMNDDLLRKSSRT